MSALKPGDVVRERGTLWPLMTIARVSTAITNHLCFECVFTNPQGRAITRRFVAEHLEAYQPKAAAR